MKVNVDNSKFYAEMHHDVEHNETFLRHLYRILGSHSHLQLVIYAMGSVECSFSSQFQLAVVLLLRRDFSNWIGDIQIYDPVISLVDVIVFKELGIEVLMVNENCKRKVERRTLFYMINPNCDLIGNLLGANWSSSCSNQIILLTNSFRHKASTTRPWESHDEAVQRIKKSFEEAEERVKKIVAFTTEIDIKTSYCAGFSGMAWHFFDVDPSIDMETSLPVTILVTEFTANGGNNKAGLSWLEMQRKLEENFLEDTQSNNLTHYDLATIYGEYRGPRQLRCNSVPPPPGWNKLNIYGIGTKGDQPGVYSGVFRTTIGTHFGRYRGIIDVDDDVLAGLEALKHGLIKYLEGSHSAQKLIVESDNVMLVQYVNERPEPNEITMHKLKEIFDLRKRVTCLIYQVYEETNEKAGSFSSL